MVDKKEVIIIGGGVIGLACAHYLIDCGTNVRVIERDKIGEGSSHGNCGLLCFSDVIPLCSPGKIKHEVIRTLKGISPLHIKPTLDIKRLIWLLKFASKCNTQHMIRAAKQKFEILNYSISLFDTLLDLDGMCCDFEKKGILTVFKSRENFEKYKGTNEFLDAHKVGAQRIEKEVLHQLEPALSSDISGAWLNPADWHLRPDMLMSSWKKYLSQQGVIFEEYCKLLNFEINGSSIIGVDTVKGRFEADTFILATGAWSPLTAKQLKLDIPVQPGKGYSITMEKPGICPSHPCVFYEKDVVATPWNSAYRLGGTMEFSGYDDYLNPKRLSKLISGAKEYLKEPAGQPVIEQWTGLRPMTFDDLPIIDRAPSQDNLIIATGHGMLGLTLATGTGKIICDMVYNRTPEINITPFGLDRFR